MTGSASREHPTPRKLCPNCSSYPPHTPDAPCLWAPAQEREK
jgi:hypothetical protein